MTDLLPFAVFRFPTGSFGCLEGEAAGEDGKAAEKRSLGIGEQVVAPGDSAASSAVVPVISPASGQDRKPVGQPFDEGRRRRRLVRAAASSIASGNPSSRWHISTTSAAFCVSRVKTGIYLPRARDEKADGLDAVDLGSGGDVWR